MAYEAVSREFESLKRLQVTVAALLCRDGVETKRG